MTRHACRVDASQADVVATLQRRGWVVRDLSQAGRGAPDLLISKAGRTVACEVKTAGTAYSKRLRASQATWRQGWQGEYVVLTSAEDALAWALNGNVESRIVSSCD